VYTHLMNTVDFNECMLCACFSARKTARLLTQYFDRYLRPTGLRATQFTVLVALIQFGQPVQLNMIAEVLGMERTTLTRNLRHLEEKGLIGTESGSDRRVKLISITERGKEMAKQVFPTWKQAQEEIARYISPQQLQQFATIAAGIS
jgi:DNA-binding MarR family transcriptional regulator